MDRSLKTLPDAVHLLQLSDLLKSSAQVVVDEWANETEYIARAETVSDDNPRILPSRKLHDAQRTIYAITGSLIELVAEPWSRVQEVGCQYWESRALYIAAERRIPDLLAEAGEHGMDIQELGQKTGIEYLKLSRLLRCLCSIHIFRQIAPTRFANNRISQALVNNEQLRAYVQLFNFDIYTASDHLPKYLLSKKGASYDVTETAFQCAVGTTKPRWDWLAERIPPKQVSPETGVGYPGVPSAANVKVKPDNFGLVTRPELENFGLAMIGGGKTSGAAHPFDFPWGDLGEALVVDVGGGVGGFVLQLLPIYSKLRYIVQDREEVIKQAKEEVWPREAPDAVRDGRVSFIVADFFEVNPVTGADIYWLRGILHDWSDEYCVRILSALRQAMTQGSRILICDQVMNTTFGCEEISPAPAPLPANYGYYTRFCHQRDLAMMGIINGIERNPSQFKDIVEKAGLRLERIWECRSVVSIIEVRL